MGAYSSAVLADNPLLYWTFDATSGTAVADSSGNARSGSLYGTATPGHTSLLTDGSGKSLGLAGGASRIPQASWMETPNFTYEQVFKPNGIGGKQVICGRDSLSGDPSIRHAVLYLDDTQLWASISSGTASWQSNLTPGGAVVNGTIYHAALTFDGATVRGYLNGSLCPTTFSTGGAAVNLTSGMEIAVGFSSGFGGIWYFQGDVDEFAYYGTALSGARIAAHYAASIAPSSTSQGTSAGTYLWAGTGAGKRPPKAVSAGTYLWAGTGAGKRSPKAATSGTYLWAGTGVGARPSVGVKQGTSVGAFNWSGTSTGVRPGLITKAGTAVGAYRWAGTGVGGVGVTTTRWTLREKATSETWTMPVNPNAMTGLPMTKQLITTANTGYQGDQRNRTFQTQTPAGQLEWSGVILTADHYDQLLAWSRKPGVIVVTDHLQRSFEVIIQAFTPDQKPGRRPGDRKRTYKMSTLFLRRLP